MSEAMPEVEVGIQIGKWVFGKVVPAEKKEEVKLPNGLKELKPYTDITILLDRSGSMSSIRSATVEGINRFMQGVDEVPGDGCWTLVTFDDPSSAKGAGEQFPYYVFKGVDTKNRPLLELNNYIPRGGTALVDAFYKVVSDLKVKISSLSREERAARKVLVVIMTDGQENHSTEYSSKQLRELVSSCQAAGWEFLYLGANQDSFTEANKYMDARLQFASPHFGGVKADWEADKDGVSKLYSSSNNASATAGTRAWKVEGNESAANLQGDGKPDIPKECHHKPENQS